MIKYSYCNHGIVFEEQWFTDDSIVEPQNGSDYLNVFALKIKDERKGVFHKQYSLITSLTDDEEDIFKKIRKNARYEIKKAERENCEFDVFSGSQIDNDLLRKFADTYTKMYASKGIKRTFNFNLMNACIEKGCIAISVGYHDGMPMVYHSYLFDDSVARLYQSCSLFRDNSDKDGQKIVGTVNRALHWNDIMHFKNNNCTQYDWGGISSLDSPRGIDVFKQGFGGTPVEYYNYSLPLNIKGKIYWFLKKQYK